MTRDTIVAEARAWLGTPYQHQAHAKGLGCDCAGLVGGVAVALGLVPADWWETDFAPHAGYARQASGDSLLAVLDRFLTRIDAGAAQPGDVLVMRFGRHPQHVGFLVPGADGPGLLHALSLPPRQVVEHRLDAQWQRRVLHGYVLPGVA